MRRLLNVSALVLAVCAALTGTAFADSSQTRSITVNGDASRPIPQTSGQAAVDATYLAAINDAIDAAQAKAASIAVKLGATLGPALTFTENYGDVSCPDSSAPVQAPSLSGSGSPSTAGQTGGSLHLPPIKHHKHPTRRHRNAADQNPICTISAYITVSYQIS